MADEETTPVRGEAASLARLVAEVFEGAASASINPDLWPDWEKQASQGEGGDLYREVERYLASGRPAVRDAIGVLEWAAGSGPVMARLRLIDGMLRHLGRDDALIDLRLRALLALEDWPALRGECERVLIDGVQSVHLAFRVLVSLNRLSEAGGGDIFELSRAALSVFSFLAEARAEAKVWWARYYKEAGDPIASLRLYREFLDTAPETNRYHASALREGAELALAGDRWGRDGLFLLQAADAGLELKGAWRAEAALTLLRRRAGDRGLSPLARLPGGSVYSRVNDAIGSPESAFDHLIDDVLPGRAAYEPRDGLLMIGTSLAAGGMERIFANSFREVRSAGVFERVRMALLNFDAREATRFYLPEAAVDPADIAVLRSNETPASPVSMLPLSMSRRTWAAYQLIRQERPRVIHAWNDLPGIVGAFAGLLAGCPRIIVHFHHMRAINLSTDRNLIRSYPACYRRLLERPELSLLFVADASAEDYADWWSVVPDAKFRRLYNGFVDAMASPGARDSLRREMGVDSDAPVLGVVFRFHKVKQPWLWIDAAAIVAQRLPKARFVMVGAGPEWEAARSQVAGLGLADRFHFPGQVRNVADYLACFDAFMLTSSVEGLPNSLVEAQMAGVPVISTDVGGARETFAPGVTGRLVEGQSPRALAEAAIDCLTNVGWRERACRKARDLAARRFGIDRYMASLIDLYTRPAP